MSVSQVANSYLELPERDRSKLDDFEKVYNKIVKLENNKDLCYRVAKQFLAIIQNESDLRKADLIAKIIAAYVFERIDDETYFSLMQMIHIVNLKSIYSLKKTTNGSFYTDLDTASNLLNASICISTPGQWGDTSGKEVNVTVTPLGSVLYSVIAPIDIEEKTGVEIQK